jgi:hypothetical protein
VSAAAENQDPASLLRVVSGDPTPEELAAVVAVLAAARATSSDGSGALSDEPHGRWTDRSRGVHTPLHPSPGGWRASAFPPNR